jgi:two-component system, OmpR family, phosphate regulon sensor histidine kinase PhoR
MAGEAVGWRQHVRLALPAIARVLAVCALGAIVGQMASPVAGLWVVVGGFGLLLVFHMYYLALTGAWLEHRSLENLPNGVGSWAEIFAKLYRVQRSSERNERRLVENEERFRLTISALPEGIVLIDAALQIEWCNPVAERHLGITLRADQGLRLTNLVRDPAFSAYMTSGAFEQPMDFRPLATPGLVLSVLLIPFEAARSIVITRDVTQRERLDQVRRDFVANVSHELRSPLTVVAGFLETLIDAKPPLDDLRRRHLDLMQEQALRMQRLIEDLLTLSRLESSERPLTDDAIDMAQLVNELADEARALSRGRHEIALSIQPGGVRGAREELRSAFANLVSNAIRYTPAGGRVALRWRCGENGGVFEVEDSGIGIAPEHLPRLTERFYRVDKSRSRETGGTGLGLAIAKHVVIRHDGRLDIRSEPGKGSVFTVQLPRARLVLAGEIAPAAPLRAA